MDMKEIEKEDVRSFADLVSILKPEDKDLNVQFGYGEFVDDWGERDTWLVSKVKELTPQEAGRTETFDGDEGEYVYNLLASLTSDYSPSFKTLIIEDVINTIFDFDRERRINRILKEEYGIETGSNTAESSTDSTDVNADI